MHVILEHTPVYGRILASQGKIRLDRKKLPGANTLAYCAGALVTKKKFYNNDTRA